MLEAVATCDLLQHLAEGPQGVEKGRHDRIGDARFNRLLGVAIKLFDPHIGQSRPESRFLGLLEITEQLVYRLAGASVQAQNPVDFLGNLADRRIAKLFQRRPPYLGRRALEERSGDS